MYFPFHLNSYKQAQDVCANAIMPFQERAGGVEGGILQGKLRRKWVVHGGKTYLTRGRIELEEDREEADFTDVPVPGGGF